MTWIRLAKIAYYILMAIGVLVGAGGGLAGYREAQQTRTELRTETGLLRRRFEALLYRPLRGDAPFPPCDCPDCPDRDRGFRPRIIGDEPPLQPGADGETF